MVSTLDFESSDPSSNLGGTSEALLYFILNLKFRRYVHALLGSKTQNVKWQNKLNFHSMQMSSFSLAESPPRDLQITAYK